MATPHSKSGDGQRPTNSDERVMDCCREAQRLIEIGDYEAARHALNERWPPEAAGPRTAGLSRHAAAELLMTAGMIAGILGAAKQTRGAQARAMQFLVESLRLFEHAGLGTKVAQARSEIAWCRWLEGDHEAARQLLNKALAGMGDDADGLKAKALALLRSAIFEEFSGRLVKALALLRDSRPLFDSCDSHVLLGKFHHELGNILLQLGEGPDREDFLDQALIEYTAASFHFEESGATRLLAHSYNNRGLVLTQLREYGEAATSLERALALFTERGDTGYAAQVNDSRARLLLEQGLNEEAETIAAGAVSALEADERPHVLAEALMTLGVALARVGRSTESCAAFGRAMVIARNAGARETAGMAALSAVEELSAWLDPKEARTYYEFADSSLEGVRNALTLRRLSKAARAAYAPWRARNSSPEPPRLLAAARRLSGNDSPALVTGKSAEARRLLACYAHMLSGRPGPFMVVDCGTIEDESPQPDFFDHIAREATGVTYFLDRVDELSRHLQTRLPCLVGHNSETPRRERLAMRIIAGTSRDLSREVALGCFDAGLFEALGGRGPHSAPSAEELEELRLLAGCFDEEAFGRYDRPCVSLPQEGDDGEWSVSLKECVKNLYFELISKALALEGGCISKAATRLHMKRQTLENIIKKHPELKEWCKPPAKR
jgi:tetratricopeptide (TPR) repeat protein